MREEKTTSASLTQSGMRILVIFLLLILSLLTYSQAISQRVTRQTATEAYSREDFATALRQFTELSQLFPRDPLYQYYCGVCLVRLEQEPVKASALLLEAIKGSAAIRTVPSDGYFYLGRAQQMSGRFEDAIKSFNNFSTLVGRREARDMNVDDFIGQCKAGEGSIEADKPDIDIRDANDQQQANNRVNADTVPGEYDKMMSQALDLQYKSDLAGRQADTLRSGLEGADKNSRKIITARIDDFEEDADEYRKQADSKIRETRGEAELTGELQPDTITENIKLSQPDQQDRRALDSKFPEVEVINDTVIIPSQRSVEIFSVFEIRKNPEAWPEENIEIDPKLPAGLVYRVQVAVFRNPVSSAYFKGMNPVYGFKNPSNGLTTYYAGLFRKSDDAGNALSRIRNLGFKDALIGAVMDGKVISADRAELLEKDWRDKPLQVLKPDLLETVADTMPPILVFRIEVSRSQKPLSKDKIDNFRKLSGNRGFDILVNESKESVYLIGKFISYQSASEFADLLVRNGLQDSRVVAYLGKREIPVDVARELFEKY